MDQLVAWFRRFVRELRRRRVIRVSVVYAGTAFVILQLGEILVEPFNLPGWTLRLVTFLLVLGFPLAVGLAWVFDVTEEGLVRTGREAVSPENGSGGKPFTSNAVLVGLLALVAALLLYPRVFPSGEEASGQGIPDTSSLDANRVAVFPFEVRGAEELEYLGESMVELLGRSLDGAGPLRTVDPKALLVRLKQDAPEERIYREVGPSEAEKVAARFGAGRFVLGSVVRVGEEIRLSGTWYGASGKELGSAEVTAAGEEEIQEAIDALARRAIADLAGEEASRRQRLAAQTTSSAEALKAYLEGQAALRRNDWERALKPFRQAVEKDSSFALAHYRLSVAAEWAGDLRLGHRAARRAADLSKDLPERDRRLIQAWQAYLKGRAENAGRLYRLLVNEHSSDADAWYQLGETLFHFGGTRGRPITEAKGPLETALELDPTASEPLLHLIQISLIERDRARLDSLTRGLGRRNLASPQETAYEAIRTYMLEGKRPPDFRGENATAVRLMTMFLTHVERFQEAEELARRLVSPDRPEELRARAHAFVARLLAGQGKLKAARKELEAAAPLDSAAYLTSRGLLATLPFLPEDEETREERQRLLEDLSTWNAEAVPERLLPALILPPASVYPPVRPYLLGLLHAQKGRRGRTREAAVRLKEMEPPELVPSGPGDFARAVEAEAQWQDGNPEEALRRLGALQHHVDPILVSTSFYSGSRERFLRAELLAEVGRLKEALRWYESFPSAYGDLPYQAPAHLGRGKVLEELGRPEEAITAYERFLELWKNADPALQPMVKEARQRLRALTDSLSDTTTETTE